MSDRELLERVAGRDHGAFSELYDRTAPWAYGIALKVLGDEARAQEALIDVYETLWQEAAGLAEAAASPLVWLATALAQVAQAQGQGTARTTS